jgi:polyferredoxin
MSERTDVVPTTVVERPTPKRPYQKGRWVDLFERVRPLKGLLRLRSFQFWAILPNLFLFYLFILAALWGTPVGSRNIMIVFVWILWWFLLITLLVPLGGRLWCTVCPLPALGEWLQRLRLVTVRFAPKAKGFKNVLFGLNRRWPKALDNIWLQNFLFLTLATFSALLVTRPIVSAFVLGGMIVLALGLALVFRQRVFCRYLCPVSGFLGLYAMTSTVALRSRDWDVCVRCPTKGCMLGSENGWGCPWMVYMGKLDRNNYCGLCMECLKSCPNDNIGLFVRPFGVTETRILHLDEAYKAFIMLVLAAVYSVTLLGPWGTFKDWANVTETGDWRGFLTYAALVWTACLVLFPAVYALFVKVSQWAARWRGRWVLVPVPAAANGAGAPNFRTLFLRWSYPLVPLGLLAWIAFSLPLFFVNGSYIVSVLSDPLGWGWNLFGTAHTPWKPLVPEWVPVLQGIALLFGLAVALRAGESVARELWPDPRQARRALVPMAGLWLAITVGFLWLFTG